MRQRRWECVIMEDHAVVCRALRGNMTPWAPLRRAAVLFSSHFGNKTADVAISRCQPRKIETKPESKIFGG